MRSASALTCLILLAACGSEPDGLIRADQIQGDAIPQALTASPGDPKQGARIFVERDSGHCILCHAVSGVDAEFQGNVGPNLTDVGARLNAGQIRLRIIDPSRLNPDTVMPSYYKIRDFHQVGDAYANEPVLSAEDIEDLVAYLAGLKG